MRPAAMRFYCSLALLSVVLLLFQPSAALAHERFIKHAAKGPLHEEYFSTLSAGTLQQENPKNLPKPARAQRIHPMVHIACRVIALIAAMLFVWFMRGPVDYFIENKLLGWLKGKAREWVYLITAFIFDEPVEHPWFNTLGEWVVIFFLRSPALVLMFAAANSALVMPSYPLDPSTLTLFRYVQVAMGIGILTQTLLPLGGATILGTFIYFLWAYDWKIVPDVLPVLTVAVVYCSLPWDSWRRVITTLDARQMRWVRIVLGASFFALGWMKIYNYYLTVGVADNYPQVLGDPMIKLFYAGAAPAQYQREIWITGFALAEVMTGFLVTVGVFSRIWSVVTVYLFTKLMLVDFGWDEIPHIFPISAFLLLVFSNNLTNEFYQVDELGKPTAHKGKHSLRYVLLCLGLAVMLAVAAVWPWIYVLVRLPHPTFF